MSSAECTQHAQVPTAKPTGDDAFEDVLYGSDSELGDSDDEQHIGRSSAPSKPKGTRLEARLRADDDEPMDLLQGTASRISSECTLLGLVSKSKYVALQFLSQTGAENPDRRQRSSRLTLILGK